MLDIHFIRGNTDAVRKDFEKRRDEASVALLEELLNIDAQWRQIKGQIDTLRAERNRISQGINEAKKNGGDASDLLSQAREIPVKIAQVEADLVAKEQRIKWILMRLPNIMDASVPFGKDDSENVTVAHFGEKPVFSFEPKNHTDLILTLGAVDLDRAAKVSGSRFYFLTGDLALLEMALQQYGMHFIAKKGFLPVVPPHMLNRVAYEGVTDLASFEDTLYKIEGEDLHLIATSEHPLTAQFQNEVVASHLLPARLAGLSPCYRKEVGTHGKDEKGIWRVHQFNKVEQIVISRPEQSVELHEEITRNAIEFFESLGLHFRQVLICTGDLGIVAAKKYDLEAWIPSVNQYKEVVSSSNCTAYQAVRLNIRYNDGKETAPVHTLNSTLVATSRALVAIIEQCQTAEGSILIPSVLRPYMGGKERIEAQKSM